MEGRLTPVQLAALRALRTAEPPFRLVGGAALAGFLTKHRETRDLDLVWYGREALDRLPEAVADLLRAAGLQVTTLQRAPSFHRLLVRAGDEDTVVDLVADAGPPLEPPVITEDGFEIPTVQEALAMKLAALLGRAEPRDLEDVRVLLEHGADLEAASRDAPRLDAGYSPLTLAWLLSTFPPLPGDLPFNRARLDAFRKQLAERLRSAGE